MKHQNFCYRHQKNASHTVFIYRNCMITIFFQKRKIVFFVTRLFYLVQIAAKTSSNFFSMIFLKFHENRMISIFPKTKKLIFYILISQNFLVVFVNEHK